MEVVQIVGRSLCCSCTLFGTNMFGTLFGTYVYGYMNTWIHMDTDIWIHIRIYGYMDIWILGYIYIHIHEHIPALCGCVAAACGASEVSEK